MKLESVAEILDTAAKDSKAVEQISKSLSFSEREAYTIQADSIKRRVARGEKVTGVKLGFTSRLKMQQMGVHDMIFGILTDGMYIEEGSSISISDYVHPRIEPELCFITKKDIDRPINLLEINQYIDGVAPAMELIDSRYENFKFSLEDVIADNCSSSGYVLGKWHPISTPIQNLGMVMSFDEQPVQIGSSAAILSNPLRSIVAAVRLALQYGQELPAGSLILAGAATPAVYLKPDTYVSTVVEKLGKISFTTQA